MFLKSMYPLIPALFITAGGELANDEFATPTIPPLIQLLPAS